jgi:lysophospholipase L1-like esterase
MATIRAGAGTKGGVKRSSCLSALLQTALVALITLALVAVFLEIGLRLFAPQVTQSISGLFQSDEAAGYRLRSNVSVPYRSSEANVTFHTGEDPGMRIVPAPATSTNRTALVLGDSFTFGMNVQDGEAFPARMVDAIGKAGGPKWRVLNGGVFGYGTDNEAAWLDEHGWAQKPSIVLVAFFVGNDVKDVMLGITKTVATDDGRLVAAGVSKQAMDRGAEDESNTPAKSSGVRGWLESNSHAFLFARSLWYNTLGKGTSKPGKLTIFDAASFYKKDVPPEIESGWQKTLGILEKMEADSKARGAQLVLVAIPAREQVYPRSWEDVKAQFALDESGFDLSLPQQKLSEFAVAKGLPYIDLLPDFKAKNSDPNLYFHIDRHWTAAGHDLAAQTIVRELKALGLLN